MPNIIKIDDKEFDLEKISTDVLRSSIALAQATKNLAFSKGDIETAIIYSTRIDQILREISKREDKNCAGGE